MVSVFLFLSDLLRASTVLFVVVDPVGIVPFVLGLTRDMELAVEKRVLRLALLTGSALLLVFAITGQQLLVLFSITVDGFKIAGGILLLLLAMEILLRGGLAERRSLEDIGVVPIAFPLLVGPGAITTTIVTLQTSGILIALLSIMVVMFITFLVFKYIRTINRLLGKRGSVVLSQLMAIFIAAIAVQFILTGIQFYYPPR